MTKFLSLVLCVLFSAVSLCDAGTKGIRASDATIIRESFDALYRFQFQRAYQTINQYIQRHPEDPLGYSVLSSISLFEELDRLSILEGEFFQDDEKIKGDKKLKPDPIIRKRIFDCVTKAQKLAQVDLAKDPKDPNALFAMTVAEGMDTVETFETVLEHAGNRALIVGMCNVHGGGSELARYFNNRATRSQPL